MQLYLIHIASIFIYLKYVFYGYNIYTQIMSLLYIEGFKTYRNIKILIEILKISTD